MNKDFDENAFDNKIKNALSSSETKFDCEKVFEKIENSDIIISKKYKFIKKAVPVFLTAAAAFAIILINTYFANNTDSVYLSNISGSDTGNSNIRPEAVLPSMDEIYLIREPRTNANGDIITDIPAQKTTRIRENESGADNTNQSQAGQTITGNNTAPEKSTVKSTAESKTAAFPISPTTAKPTAAVKPTAVNPTNPPTIRQTHPLVQSLSEDEKKDILSAYGNRFITKGDINGGGGNGDSTNIESFGFFVEKHYGTYNGCYAVVVNREDEYTSDPVSEIVAGYTFHYQSPKLRILIVKGNDIYYLTEAFQMGLLSENDIETIYDLQK